MPLASDVAGPDFSPSVRLGYPRSISKSSMGSSHSSVHRSSGRSATSSTASWSSASPSSSKENLSVDYVVEGVPHVAGHLDPRQYKTPRFVEQLLEITHALSIPAWTRDVMPASSMRIQKVSGALTNAVFFVSSLTTPARTLLLRVYGPSSSALIARPRELHILHVLSSTYHMGPRVYGTFDNGRIEEYFDSETLTGSAIRDPLTSSYIGARMAELHGADVDALEPEPLLRGLPRIAVETNVRSWLVPARSVLELPAVPESVRAEFDLDAFQRRWEHYLGWLKSTAASGALDNVFCHNDAQYGNLLRLKKMKSGRPEHHQIIVVDFEYAAPNPGAYDIANHFHEWTANYHGATPHLLDIERYPSPGEQDNFLTAYLSYRNVPLPSGRMVPYDALSKSDQLDELATLRRQVRLWSPASHAMWTIWGLVQARDDVERRTVNPEFDYIAYARGRLQRFHAELDELSLGL
ncbi:unnamed protein product [Peniophora sp. CBMAI 1063]|nr:unnamed protein product [Peniophora sp. CBMAI 1063]